MVPSYAYGYLPTHPEQAAINQAIVTISASLQSLVAFGVSCTYRRDFAVGNARMTIALGDLAPKHQRLFLRHSREH